MNNKRISLANHYDFRSVHWRSHVFMFPFGAVFTATMLIFQNKDFTFAVTLIVAFALGTFLKVLYVNKRNKYLENEYGDHYESYIRFINSNERHSVFRQSGIQKTIQHI